LSEVDDRGLRARDDGDLALGLQVDAVRVGVAVGDRLLQGGEAGEGRVAVDARVGIARDLGEALDDVGRRPYLGVAAGEVYEWLAFRGGRDPDGREEVREVLLR
jgi:DNA helicase TIP49 (TBP-interacting protein)